MSKEGLLPGVVLFPGFPVGDNCALVELAPVDEGKLLEKLLKDVCTVVVALLPG